MNNNEWPLVFFTLFTQASVGITVLGVALIFAFRQEGGVGGPDFKKAVLVSSLALMAVALLISFLHLSRPLASVYALQNLGTSWLSREIILGVVFFCLLALAFILLRIQAPGKGHSEMALVAAAVIGLTMVFSMVRLYMIPTVPSWNNPSTPIAFFNSSLLLGSLIGLCLLVFLSNRGISAPVPPTVVRILTMLVLAGTLIHFGNAFFTWAGPSPQGGSFPPPELPMVLKMTQGLFLFIGLSFLVVWYSLGRGNIQDGHPLLLRFSVAGFFLAELVSRYMFYASYYRLGV